MKKSKKNIFAFGAALAVAAGVYLTFQNEALTLTEYEFASDKVPQSFDGFKILHLSDIHAKRPRSLHGALLRLAGNQKPDIIVITGDLIDHRSVNIPCAASLAGRLAEIAPVYYVTGNHEEQLDISDYTEALTKLSQAGAGILDSRRVILERGEQAIALSGIFDLPVLRKEDAEGLFEPNALNLVLCHRPQLGGLLAEAGVDLIFSGHAHGGQMQIPFIGGLIAPDQGFFPKYSGGIYRFGRSVMVLSRGIGNSLIPFRVNNRPEAVCITLRAEG